MKKEKFLMNDRLYKIAEYQGKIKNKQFTVDMDNFTDFITSYKNVYELLPFESIRDFEKWVKNSDNTSYDIETILNIISEIRPISEFIDFDCFEFCNDLFNDYSNYDFNDYEFNLITDMEKFKDLLFIVNFYQEFNETLKKGNFKNAIKKELSLLEFTTVGVLIGELQIDNINMLGLPLFAVELIQNSTYYRSIKS